MHSYQRLSRLISRATTALQRVQFQLQTAGDLLRSLEGKILELRNNRNFLILEIQRLTIEVETLQREVSYIKDTDNSLSLSYN